MKTENIFQYETGLLNPESPELMTALIESGAVSIERIVSKGHTSPVSGWYDQAKNEWVMVLKGEAVITFEDGREIRLLEGAYVNIPAHCKHRVSWTAPDIETIWLAVHYP